MSPRSEERGPRASSRGRRRSWRVLLAAVVLATLTVGAMGGGPTLQARWHVEESVSVPSTRSDSLASGLTDRTPGVAPGIAPNTPTLQVALGATTRQSPLVDVVSLRATVPATAPAAPGTGGVLAESGVRYRLAPVGGTCAVPGSADYWVVGGPGAVAPDTTYIRTGAVPPGAAVPAGGSRQVCPQVTPASTGDTLFLRHGGRAVDLQTTGRVSTQAPATWSSPPSTATSRYRVGFPAIGPTTGTGTCVTPGLLPGLAGGGIAWTWPSASTTHGTATPAVATWQVRWRVPNGTGPWSTLDLPGTARRVPAADLPFALLTTYDVVVRAYPFAGVTTSYVDAVTTRASKTSVAAWLCGQVQPGTGGPVGMP